MKSLCKKKIFIVFAIKKLSCAIRRNKGKIELPLKARKSGNLHKLKKLRKEGRKRFADE